MGRLPQSVAARLPRARSSRSQKPRKPATHAITTSGLRQS